MMSFVRPRYISGIVGCFSLSSLLNPLVNLSNPSPQSASPSLLYPLSINYLVVLTYIPVWYQSEIHQSCVLLLLCLWHLPLWHLCSQCCVSLLETNLDSWRIITSSQYVKPLQLQSPPTNIPPAQHIHAWTKSHQKSRPR